MPAQMQNSLSPHISLVRISAHKPSDPPKTLQEFETYFHKEITKPVRQKRFLDIFTISNYREFPTGSREGKFSCTSISHWTFHHSCKYTRTVGWASKASEVYESTSKTMSVRNKKCLENGAVDFQSSLTTMKLFRSTQNCRSLSHNLGRTKKRTGNCRSHTCMQRYPYFTPST